jgi:hypothetical protein
VSASAQSGVVFSTNFADTAWFVTVPVNEPPDVPSQVKVPESNVPLWVIAIVILQPKKICSQPVFVQEPDTSNGGLGAGAGEEHAGKAKATTKSTRKCRISE